MVDKQKHSADETIKVRYTLIYYKLFHFLSFFKAFSSMIRVLRNTISEKLYNFLVLAAQSENQNILLGFE